MKKAIELIEKLIKEHEEIGYCTNYTRAMDELNKDVQNAFDYAYDCGRYDTLVNLLNDLERMEDC